MAVPPRSFVRSTMKQPCTLSSTTCSLITHGDLQQWHEQSNQSGSDAYSNAELGFTLWLRSPRFSTAVVTPNPLTQPTSLSEQTKTFDIGVAISLMVNRKSNASRLQVLGRKYREESGWGVYCCRNCISGAQKSALAQSSAQYRSL